MNTLDVNDSVKVLVFVEAIIVRYCVLQNQHPLEMRILSPVVVGYVEAGQQLCSSNSRKGLLSLETVYYYRPYARVLGDGRSPGRVKYFVAVVGEDEVLLEY